MNYPEFKVFVKCFTFNQAKYIKDALNGFVMQETDFPFICGIVDDASTDGEQEVIREYVSDNFDVSESSCYFERETDYAHITYAQHKTNKNCYFVVLYLKENHYSIKKSKAPYLLEWREGCKYEALCEGDDYWIDSNKLQNQVEILDNDYSIKMCVHNCLERTGDVFKEHSMNIEDGYLDIATVIDLWAFIPTNSIVYRSELVKSAEYSEFIKGCPVGDGPLQIYAAIKGKIWYINKYFSVYRVASDNSWSQKMANDVNLNIVTTRKCIEWIEYADAFTNKKYHELFLFTKSRRQYILATLTNQYYKIFISPRLFWYYFRHVILPSVKRYIRKIK